MVLAPDGERVAYVTPGSSAAVTASLWPVNASTSTAPRQEAHPEAVWVAPLDGIGPPRRIFELASASTPSIRFGIRSPAVRRKSRRTRASLHSPDLCCAPQR